MPEEFNRLVKNRSERVPSIVVAIRARKHDHAEFHREYSPPDFCILPQGCACPENRVEKAIN
jgi:hypothetical protein